MDDLTAALANFDFYILPQGEVRFIKHICSSGLNRFQVRINKIGVYVGGNYDFNDEGAWISQPSGFWEVDRK